MESQVIVNQIIIAGILICIGVIGSLTKVITETVRTAISKLVFNITLPLLIITTFSNMELNREIIINGLWIFIFSNISLILLLLIGKFTALFTTKVKRTASIHIVHTMFGNIVYLGFPLIYALFPQQESMLYAGLYYLVSTYFLWTIGVLLLTSDKSVNMKENLKNLINPDTIAFIIGILMMVTGIKFPTIIYDALSGMGKITSPLSMLYIGALLANTNIKGVFKRLDIYFLSLNKLLIVPLLVLFLVNEIILYFGIEFSLMAKTVLILQTSMPCMTMVVIVAGYYGADDQKAAENVFLSTLLSLVTLPLMFYLIKYFG